MGMMGNIGVKNFDSLEEEIKYYIDGFIRILKGVNNWTLKELDSMVREDFFTLSIVTLSANNEYPTYEDLERVRRIIRLENVEIEEIFPPEYYQHVLRENVFVNLDEMRVFNTTKLVVKYENQYYREKPFALVKEAKFSYSFLYLNLLKRITEYLIGSSPRKASTNQLYRVSFLIQAQTNYIMNNLEILDLCRGRNAEYVISPHGLIRKKSVYEEKMKESLKSLLEATQVSYKEAKERREQEEEWEELQRLNEEEEEEEEERRKKRQKRIWMEEEERKRKEEEEHFRQMREMNEWMMWEDDFIQNNPQLFN